MGPNALPSNKSLFGEEFNRSVLDSLTAHVAVIDRQGKILAVNRAWERFARENGDPPQSVVGGGADYFAACRAAVAAGDSLAADAMVGMESVLHGDQDEFVFEYPCHAPDEHRWFLMKVAPLPYAGGAVIAHEDITARKLAEQALAESHLQLEERIKQRTAELEAANRELHAEIAERARAEQGLRQAATVFDNANEAIIVTDENCNIVAVNAAFAQITGFSAEEALGKNPRIQQSGRNSDTFYERLWDSLNSTGRWQGEIWNRRKNGEVYAAWESISAVRDEDGRIVNYVAVLADISDVKTAQAQLADLAHHDQLTGLANRLLFTARLEQALERAKRHKTKLALLFLDLDRFKIINDTLGHTAGDKLLQTVGRRIQECVRHEDTVARLGGDEFTILLEEIKQPQDAAHLASKLGQALAGEIEVDGFRLTTSASIGISVYPDDGTEGSDLLRSADAAMYSAKDHGRSTYRFYRTELTDVAFEHLSVENGLRHALAHDELTLFYQPQLVAKTGELYGLEALVRWRSSDSGLILPDRFIAIAEETGLIHELGEWVLHTAFCQIRDWWAEGLHVPRLAVNASARELLHDHLGDRIRSALEDAKLDPSETAVELEITESTLQRTARSRAILASLRSVGVHIAIDDFGTGYSSLSQLKQLPLDTLKIDRSFLHDLNTDPDSRAIVTAILAMGQSLQLKVVGEGVETQAQFEYLRDHGCDAVQGNFFSEPLCAEATRDFLHQHR